MKLNKPIKNIFLFAIICSIVVIAYSSLSDNYDFEHIYSPEGNSCVTRIEISSMFSGNKTIFTQGYYTEKNIPEIFVRPKYSGFTSGFQLIVFWDNEICHLVSYMDNYELRNTNDNFNFHVVDIESFNKMKNDTTGIYNYQIEPEIDFGL